MTNPDLAKRPPVNLCLLAGQRDHPAVDVRGRVGPQAAHQPPDLHGRAGITPEAEHLVEPRGAEAGILRQGVADERQKGVEGTRAAHASADTARLVLQRDAYRLMVDAEGGGDGPDLPVLAEREAPDLGALRGRAVWCQPRVLIRPVEDQRLDASRLLQPVDAADVRMVQ